MAIVSKEFEENARISSQAFGLPVNRFVVVPDSPEGIADDKIRAEVDAVIDNVVEYLTTPPPAPGGIGAVTPSQARSATTVEQYEGRDQFEALDRFNRTFLQKDRGDGFSLVPPTRERVAEMLKGTTKAADDVVAILQPGMGIATVEKIAINCVMAGCEPKHLPVIMAAVKAIEAMGFYARGWLMSTSVNAPMLFLCGPIVEELGIHTGQCTLGPSKWSQTNIVLGRALRLVLMNVGYNRPRVMDMDTIGTPLKWSFCTAENQERNPWQPFHVEQGFDRDTNMVCVTSMRNQIEIADFVSKEPEALLNEFVHGTLSKDSAFAVSNRGEEARPQKTTDPNGQRKMLPGGLFIMLAPEHAELLSRFQWPKASIRNYLWMNQKIPARWVANLAKWFPPHEVREEWKWLLKASEYDLDRTMLACRPSPASYHVAVVGGWGAKSLVFTCSELSMMEVTDRTR